MSSCLELCKHTLTLYSTLCDWNLAESQHWKIGGTNATNGNQAPWWLGGQKDGWNTKKVAFNMLCVDEKEIKSQLSAGQKKKQKDWSLSSSGPLPSQVMNEMLTGNVTAPWEHKYVRTWVLSISWCRTSPTFPFHFPPRVMMIGLTFGSGEWCLSSQESDSLIF